MNSTSPGRSAALQLFQPATGAVYSIDAVARLTRTPRHRIAVYCRHGLITPLTDPDQAGWNFDDDAIRVLRRIEGLRATYGVNLSGLRLLLELARDLERLRQEVRFLRGH